MFYISLLIFWLSNYLKQRKMKVFTRYSILLLIIALLSNADNHLSAQKVALVLSGGGAKGVAHIGVIKALEDNNIPIDYIAGTSMGAIIGGLYAAGYSPEQMEDLLKSEEFKIWIAGKIDPQYIYFYKQPYPDASWFAFRFKVDSVFQSRLPTNIVSPESMDFAFMELFAGASAVAKYNFDSLMVPFRCVAADIQDNKPMVLRNGDLGKSIRASMTFPFYFKPVRINGKLLFDGGMYNNFPSDVALNDFNPDIIIGVKASADQKPPTEDDVTSQLQTMLMEHQNYDVLCENSILIEPKLKQVNVIDFKNTGAFIDSGYMAAVRKIPEIRLFVLDTVTKEQRTLQRAAFNAKKPPYLIRKYNISGLTKGQYKYATSILRREPRKNKSRGIQIQGDSLQQIKPEYFKLISEDNLTHAFPTLTYDENLGGYIMGIDAKHENRMIAHFGGNISSKSTNTVFLQAEYNYWNRLSANIGFNTYIGRFYNSAKVGGRLEWPAQLPFYFDASFIFNSYNFQNTNNTYFFDYSSPIYLTQRENFLDVRIGSPIGNKGRLELFFQLGDQRFNYYQTNTFTSKDTLDKSFFEFNSPGFDIEFNTLNRKQFANSGKRVFFTTSLVTGTEIHSPGSTAVDKTFAQIDRNYLQFRFEYLNYLKARGMYTFGWSAQAVASFQKLSDNYTSSMLLSPSYTFVSEISTQFLVSYRNPIFVAAGIHNVFTLMKNLDFRVEGGIMLPYREIVRDEDQQSPAYVKEFSKVHYIGSSRLVYQTALGPISAAVNYLDVEDRPWSFNVNIGFLLYNRPAVKQ